MEEDMELYEKLLKTMFELKTGTYKRKSNKQILKEYNKTLKQFKSTLNLTGYISINQTCTTDCQIGKTHKSFNNNMHSITINEMTLGNTYKNKYIKLEIYTEIILMTSIMFLGKDNNNDLTLIAIYNFENFFGTKDYKKLKDIFKKGKYIIVLEPFYKMFGSGDEGIRIEDPNEIIIFDDKEWIDKFLNNETKENYLENLNNKENDNIDFLYKKANQLLENKDYNTALAHFTKLKSLIPNDNEIDLQLGKCYFELPYYTKTINKCDEIINKNQDNVDAILLKIKSLIQLKKVLEAKELFNLKKQIIEKYKKQDFLQIDEEITNKIKNMNGYYNFADLYKQSKESLIINIGEYINKKLKINFDNSNKGIGIYTNEKIKKGELLVVSKALVAIKLNKNEDNIKMEYDNPTQEEFEKTGQSLIYRDKKEIEEILSFKLSNYPEDYIEFLELYDGKNINLNLEKRKKEKNINLKKIQDVIKFNSFSYCKHEKHKLNGLWYFPSFFNHSCIPNCYYFGFGDILIIISLSDIEADNELFINYCVNDMDYESRQKCFKQNYNFYCNCQLCQYEKNQFQKYKEKTILENYLQQLEINVNSTLNNNINKNVNKEDIEKMEKFIENNKKIFCCYEKNIFYFKSAYYMNKYDHQIAYEYLEKALRYSENRNYFFEQLNLLMMNSIAKQLKNKEKIKLVKNKLNSFWEKYFPGQKEFIEILNYLHLL